MALPFQLDQPILAVGERVIDDMALGCCLPFRSPVEESGLQQLRRQARVTRRDIAGDCVFPGQGQSGSLPKQLCNPIRVMAMMDRNLSVNLWP